MFPKWPRRCYGLRWPKMQFDPFENLHAFSSIRLITFLTRIHHALQFICCNSTLVSQVNSTLIGLQRTMVSSEPMERNFKQPFLTKMKSGLPNVPSGCFLLTVRILHLEKILICLPTLCHLFVVSKVILGQSIFCVSWSFSVFCILLVSSWRSLSKLSVGS